MRSHLSLSLFHTHMHAHTHFFMTDNDFHSKNVPDELMDQQTYGSTDRWTDRTTDTASYRDVRMFRNESSQELSIIHHGGNATEF